MPYRGIAKYFLPIYYSEDGSSDELCYVIKYGRWNGYIANNGHVESLMYLRKNLDHQSDIDCLDRIIEVTKQRFHKPIKV